MEKSNEVGKPETNTPEVTQTQVDSPQQPKIDPTLQKNANNKWIIPMLIGLLVIAAGAAGYFAYQNYQLKQQNKQRQPSLTPIIAEPTTTVLTTDVPSSTPGVESSWETHTNTKLGFEIKHPDNWKPCLTQGIASYFIDVNQECKPPYAEYFLQFSVKENTQTVDVYSPPGVESAYEATGKQTVTLGSNQYIKQGFKQVEDFSWNEQTYPAGPLVLFYDLVDINENRVLEFYKSPGSSTDEGTIEQVLSTLQL